LPFSNMPRLVQKHFLHVGGSGSVKFILLDPDPQHLTGVPDP
jgi:hypothetical protein